MLIWGRVAPSQIHIVGDSSLGGNCGNFSWGACRRQGFPFKAPNRGSMSSWLTRNIGGSFCKLWSKLLIERLVAL